LLAYFNSFSVPFHYDDISFLRENLVIKSFQLFLTWITESYSRIITGRAFLLFTFYLNYVINGLDTFGYHLVNLFIHISTAFLFYLLLSKYVYNKTYMTVIPTQVGIQNEKQKNGFPLKDCGNDEEEVFSEQNVIARNDNSGVAILAATLFLLHPINTESVTYISSRSSVLSAFFILASILAFFRATFYRHPINSSLSPSPQSPPLKGGGIREETPIEGGGIREETPIEGGDLKVVFSPLWKRTQKFPSPLAGEGKGEGGFNGRNFHAGYYILSIISFFLGLSTKEAAIVTPILILLFDLYFVSDSDKGKNFRARLKYHLPFWIMVIAGFFYYSGYIASPAMYRRPWLMHIFTELKVFVEYLRLLIFPFGLNIDHDIKASISFDSSVIISIIIITGLLLIALFLRKRNRGLSFSILWFFLNLAPFLTIRLQDYMAERWVYAASIGFALFVSELLIILLGKHKKILVFAVVCLTVFFGILTHMRNDIYKDPITLWRDAVKKSPDKIRPYTNLCAYHVERREMDRAIEVCEAAINKGSNQAETYINLATAYFFKNDLDNAEKILLSMADKKAVMANVSNTVMEVYYYNLGSIYKGKKEYDKAIEEYKNVLKIRPRSPAALGLIGECYYLLGMKGRSDEYFHLTTEGMPQNGDDYIMLAKSAFHLGDNRKAVDSLNKAVITDPMNVNVRHAVATIFLEGGNPEAAYKHFSVMAKLSPNYAPAYTGMGKSMLATGNLKEARKHFNKALSLLPLGFESQRPNSPERKELLELLTKTQG